MLKKLLQSIKSYMADFISMVKIGELLSPQEICLARVELYE
jgi:hypothetical protein